MPPLVYPYGFSKYALRNPRIPKMATYQRAEVRTKRHYAPPASSYRAKLHDDVDVEFIVL